MKRPRHLTLAAIVVAALASPAGAQTFNTTLTGAAEGSSGSPNGSGLAAITFDGTTVHYALSVKGITTPTAAHIHRGAVGVPGPVVVGFNPVFDPTSLVASGTVTASSVDAADIVAHPENYYVNVHTPEFPAGAVRGQLNGTPPHGVTYGIELTGAGEAPAAASTTGGGLAVVTISDETVSFNLLVNGVAPITAAHIHRGTRGQAGPVLIGFSPVFTGGVASGTVTTTVDLAREIRAHPQDFYVNVHNADFPGGALRGQLFGSGSAPTFLPTIAKASGAQGTNFVSDLRVLNPTGLTAHVTAEFFAANNNGLTGPSATTSFTVAPNTQAVYDDALQSLFLTSGSGALKIASDVPVVVRSRVLNDLRNLAQGTTGVLVPGLTMADARTGATIPMLSNASASDIAEGTGFRTNLGFFNPGTATASIKFSAFKTDGTPLGNVTIGAAPLARVQQAIFTLIPVSDKEQRDFYITFTSTLPVFVYAAVVDNKTGDSIYLDAATAP